MNEVKEVVPSERLLIFNVKEGWEPLCKFLNLPIPKVPFPQVNDTESMIRGNMRLQRVSFVVVYILPSVFFLFLGLIIQQYFA